MRRRLRRDLGLLGVAAGEQGERRMLDFLRLLGKWNRSYNLTAVRDPDAMLTQHLVDSLSVASYVRGSRLLDVGAGAGLPGIPLAVAFPGLSVTLIEARNKKVQFLLNAVSTLGLANVQVVHGRVEQYRPEVKFDTLVSRAFGSLSDYLGKAGHLCDSDGRMLAMKGAYPDAELGEVDRNRFSVTVERLRVPALDAERHIVILRHRSGAAPGKTR